MTQVAQGANSQISDKLIDEDADNSVFKLHRSAYTSQAIFDAEMRRYRNEHWLYLGHESEIPKPGDYVVRELAQRSLIFCRDAEGEIRVFLNACPHRGTVVCRQPAGNAKFFTCFYHGFTFSNSGPLVSFGGDDDPKAYPSDFRDTMRLRPVAQIESYRGFVFISFNSKSSPLNDHLGAVTEHLDLIVDQGSKGVEVVKGTHIYASNCNWKLAVENALDSPHFFSTHQTFIDWRKSTGFHAEDPQRTWADLGNGHIAEIDSGYYGRSGLCWEPAWGEEERVRIEGVRRELDERLGEERARRVYDESRNTYVFPNLIIFDFIGISFRVIEPVSPGVTRFTAYEFGVVGESAAARKRRLDNLITFVGPGGFATPDDLEAQQLAQSGYMATADDGDAETPWNDISRGYAQEVKGEPGDLFNEENLRAFWRHWNSWLHHDEHAHNELGGGRHAQ